MRRIVLAAALFILAGHAASAATPKQLIAQWQVAYAACREAQDYTSACDTEFAIYFKMGKLGWCFGKKTDKAQYQHDWHRCTKDSWHAKDLVPKGWKP